MRIVNNPEIFIENIRVELKNKLEILIDSKLKESISIKKK